MITTTFISLLCMTLLFISCSVLDGMMRKGSRVAAERIFTPDRTYEASAINIPPGYRAELVTKGLTYSTAVTFGEQGNVYVIEAGYA